jgi:hypothetical protein
MVTTIQEMTDECGIRERAYAMARMDRQSYKMDPNYSEIVFAAAQLPP